MARINKSKLTKLEIIREASKMFLENGYSATSAKAICAELGMSTGNLTFHYPTKEHLLVVLVDLLCKYQWKAFQNETQEGVSSIMAICLELTAMAVMCEGNPIARDFYLSSYISPMSLDMIRKNDKERAKTVFAEYCNGWTDEQFSEAEVLVSGIEYATLMTTESSASLEYRIKGALEAILAIYNVPKETIETKMKKVFDMDYREIGHTLFNGFKKYVEEANENAFSELVNKTII